MSIPFMFVCSWLRNLNEYGVCLLTNVSTEPGIVKKVYLQSQSLCSSQLSKSLLDMTVAYLTAADLGGGGGGGAPPFGPLYAML